MGLVDPALELIPGRSLPPSDVSAQVLVDFNDDVLVLYRMYIFNKRFLEMLTN